MRKGLFLLLVGLLIAVSFQLIKPSLCSAQCPDSIGPPFKAVVMAGGIYTINVTAPGGCSWTATSNDAWITVDSGNTGTGNGVVEYSVEENIDGSGCGCDPRDERTGTITIGDKTFTVFQGSELNVGHVAGKVYDNSTGNAVTGTGIEGAIVTVNTTPPSTFTTIAGGGYFFQLIDDTGGIPGTTYTISATHADYSDSPGTNTVVKVFILNDDVHMSMTPKSTAPVVTMTGSSLSYTEGDGAVVVDGGLTITDPDDTGLTGATVIITSGHSPSEDVLSFTNQPGITGSYNSSTGVLALSGTTTVANYQAAIRTVTYENTSNIPDTTQRTITVTVNDGVDTGSDTRNIDITAQNGVPTITANGSGGTITLGPNDTLSVEVSLAAGASAGVNADWWLAASVSGTSTIDGWYYFDFASLGLVSAGTSPDNLLATFWGPLSDLVAFQILDISVSVLPPGIYTFYFAIDVNMSGTLDPGELVFDLVVVNITL